MERERHISADTPTGKVVQSSSRAATTIACLSCRSRKIRCERSGTPSDKCKHCTLTNGDCQTQRHHRGKAVEGRVDLRKHRKRKAVKGSGVADIQQYTQGVRSASGSSSQSPNDSSSSQPRPKHQRLVQIVSPHTHTNIPPESSPSSSDTCNQALPLFHQPSPVPRPRPSQVLQESFINAEALANQPSDFGKSLRDEASGSLDRSLDGYEEGGDQGHVNFNIATNIHSDALANGIISWDRLETIFIWYIRRVDPHAGLLDPDLHTPGYTRQHYPLLFSALTTMAAMARQDPEYTEMAKIHEGLDAFATLSGYLCLDRVLARIAMIILGIGEGRVARRQDQNRLHRIHQILLDAIDLGLHKGAQDHAKDELDWRERGSRSRTWIQLCLIYQTYRSDIIQQTDCILGQSIPTSDTFLGDLSPRYTTVADYRLASSLEIVAIRCDIIQAARTLQPHFTSSSRSLIRFGAELAKLHQRLSDIFQKWFIRDGDDVFARGRLDNLTSQDIYCTFESTLFYLNQVTWLWASSMTDCGSSQDDGLRMGIDAIVHPSHTAKARDQQRLSSPTINLSTDERYWFQKTQSAALQVLKGIQKLKDVELTLSQDFVYVCASKISLWLSRYHKWFPVALLIDLRNVMLDLSTRCMAATSRRGNTLRCFARLMNSVVQSLPPRGPSPQEAANYGQHPPSPLLPLSSYNQQDGWHGLESQTAPVPTMSMEADAGLLRSLPNTGAIRAAAVADQLPFQPPAWQTQQDQPAHSTVFSANVTSPRLDLGHFLDVEDLRHWEELLGLDLQLGHTA